ncbi:MAG TPA: hypothetical protein VFO27_19425, partial [Bryobacteraceae bacterium]|nr:hypothetical protein [Bryobacteraceae bacterium]
MPFPRFGRVTRAGEFERRRYQTDGRNPAAKHAILEMYQKHGVVFPDTPTMALHRGRIDLLAEHLRRDPKLLSRTFSHREIYPAEMGCRDP